MNHYIKALILLTFLYTISTQKGYSQSNFSGLFSATAAFSQAKFAEAPVAKTYDHINAVGIRVGGTSGITYKHFFANSNAFEGIIGIWPNAFGITGLYEKYAPTGANGLKFYYGAGGHFTTETQHYSPNDPYSEGYIYSYRTAFGIGLDGIVGIDYKIPSSPVSVSFDLKPLFEVSNNWNLFSALDPGLGIKVAF